YSKTVTILEGEYTFPTDMKIRFMCDASANADDVYIDEIRILASSIMAPPDCATVASPGNNATDVSIYTGLEWYLTNNATGYFLYFGTNNPPSNMINGVDLGNVTIYDPADLLISTTYYWKVVPYNNAGNASDCEVWTFTTEAESVAFDELSFSDFESGWDIWTDGGGDCALYTSGTYAPQGTNAAEIRDNSGTASSCFHTTGGGYSFTGICSAECRI
nr:hypothetical protein [Bacteroidota bacterium]